MPLDFRFIYDRQAWLDAIREKQRPVAEAAVAALQDTAQEAVTEGRSNIASSGRFGSRWQQGLKFKMKDAEDGGLPSLNAKAIIFHSFRIAGIFEYGGTIKGKPLLWIPATPGGPPASRSGKKLVSATIRGQPVLFDAGDPDRHRKPLYIGVPQVTIRKKWRITEIVQERVNQIAVAFIKHFKDN